LDGVSEYTVCLPVEYHIIQILKPSDLQYEYSKTSSTGDSKEVAALLERVKTLLPPLLEARFKAFPQALLDTHGKDITVVVTSEGNTPAGSGTVTPALVAPSNQKASSNTAPASSTATATKSTAAKGIINTATVKVSSRFMASAEDLWGLFTDEGRIPMWSRAPAQASVPFLSL
jgi:activator of HSP90 ATPase